MTLTLNDPSLSSPTISVWRSPARAGQAGVGEDQPAAVARRLLTTFHAFTAAVNFGVRRET